MNVFVVHVATLFSEAEDALSKALQTEFSSGPGKKWLNKLRTIAQGVSLIIPDIYPIVVPLLHHHYGDISQTILDDGTKSIPSVLAGLVTIWNTIKQWRIEKSTAEQRERKKWVSNPEKNYEYEEGKFGDVLI
jgi:hypothetical protein